jgi:hypothetical protein
MANRYKKYFNMIISNATSTISGEYEISDKYLILKYSGNINIFEIVGNDYFISDNLVSNRLCIFSRAE